MYIICPFLLGVAVSLGAASNLAIPDEILERWNSLSLSDKLPYIMAPEDRQYKYNEYLRFGTSGGEDCFDFDSFFEKLAEFQGDESVRIFFSYMDLDKDGKICFEEYLYGRGEFEQNGNRYDFNEYEFVEKLMDEDLQKLQSERVGRIQQATFKYDEHGIIID